MILIKKNLNYFKYVSFYSAENRNRYDWTNRFLKDRGYKKLHINKHMYKLCDGRCEIGENTKNIRR